MAGEFVKVVYTDPNKGGPLWQADCDLCGWHTRQADVKRWVLDMAERHRSRCPVIKEPVVEVVGHLSEGTVDG